MAIYYNDITIISHDFSSHILLMIESIVMNA